MLEGSRQPASDAHLLAALLPLLLRDLGRRSERQLLAVPREVLERHFGGPSLLSTTVEHCRMDLGCSGSGQRLPEARAVTGRRGGRTRRLQGVSSDQCKCWGAPMAGEGRCMGRAEGCRPSSLP